MPKSGTKQQAIEDYLKAIYLLSDTDELVSTTRIATALGVQPPSVTNMLKRLAHLDLVHYEKHYGVTLTKAGKSIALETVRHHRLLELYLTEKLGFRWDEVHDEAEVLEHVISEQLEARLAEALGHPEYDPHGEPIPSADGELPIAATRRLTTLQVGEEAIVARVVDDTNKELLCYLADVGIVPGVAVTVIATAPFDGPITVDIDNKREVVGYKAAATVCVE